MPDPLHPPPRRRPSQASGPRAAARSREGYESPYRNRSHESPYGDPYEREHESPYRDERQHESPYRDRDGDHDIVDRAGTFENPPPTHPGPIDGVGQPSVPGQPRYDELGPIPEPLPTPQPQNGQINYGRHGGPTAQRPPGGPSRGRHRVKDDKPKRPGRTIIEWALVIGGALLVALVVRSTLAQAYWIPSPSMEPTLNEGDRVLVNKLSYRLHDVHRGDIIVFKRPEQAESSHPEDDIQDLIKRVIGLPGDKIESRDDGFVYINGKRLEEPYLPDNIRTDDLKPQTIPEGKVFVMGDNRTNSQDSRFFGPVDEDLIVGRAFIKIYPLSDIGGL